MSNPTDKGKITDACWLWPGVMLNTGYGVIRRRGKDTKAHRAIYEAAVGPVPDGMVLDHLCRNRACFNPFHLEPVTGKENTLRGESFAAQNARKRHCPKGHEFSPENTLIERGARVCLQCKRAINRESAKRYKAKKLASQGAENGN
jgi:hypothetical protein